MLKDQKITNPGQLAIDRPSGKFQSFLRKHYGLSRNIPQVFITIHYVITRYVMSFRWIISWFTKDFSNWIMWDGIEIVLLMIFKKKEQKVIIKIVEISSIDNVPRNYDITNQNPVHYGITTVISLRISEKQILSHTKWIANREVHYQDLSRPRRIHPTNQNQLWKLLQIRVNQSWDLKLHMA